MASSRGMRLMVVIGVLILLLSSIWAWNDRDQFAAKLDDSSTERVVLADRYDELRERLDAACLTGDPKLEKSPLCQDPAPPAEDIVGDVESDTNIVPVPGPEGDKGDKGDTGEQGPPPSFDVVLGAVRAMCEPLPFACDQPDPDDPETQDEEAQDAEEQEGEIQEAEEQEAEIQEEEVQDAEVQETIVSIDVVQDQDTKDCVYVFHFSDGSAITTNAFDCTGPQGPQGPQGESIILP